MEVAEGRRRFFEGEMVLLTSAKPSRIVSATVVRNPTSGWTTGERKDWSGIMEGKVCCAWKQ